MVKLKPCPFCGSEAEIVSHKFFSQRSKKWELESYGVECKNCHTSGYQFFDSEKQATEAWNRRADAADVVEVVRCKDCVWYDEWNRCVNSHCTKSYYGCRVPANYFCSYGEQEDGASDDR